MLRPDRRLEAPELSAPLILILGPDRQASSGIGMHLERLFDSDLARLFRLKHFQVGHHRPTESWLARVGRHLSSPFRLAVTLAAEKTAIVHLNTSLNWQSYWRDLPYLLVARLSGARVIYQIHGGDLAQQFATQKRLPAALLRAALRWPDAIVVLARNEREVYRNFVPGQSIRLIPNAIDYRPYAKLPGKRPTTSSRLQLLYIGRLARDEGIFDALQGLKLARNQGIAAHLTVAGDGPDEKAVFKRVEDLALTAAVSFVGPVSGDARLKCFVAADLLLLPSYAEGLPYALLEAMAAGVPAIATRVGAIPDVLLDGVHGLFVAPGDARAIGQAISRLATNRHLLQQMSSASRKRIAQNYSVQRLVREFAQLYAELGTAGKTPNPIQSPLLKPTSFLPRRVALALNFLSSRLRRNNINNVID